jgi:enoyl-CoA hydratase/carnithine racemase
VTSGPSGTGAAPVVTDAVRVDRRGAALWATLDRPRSLNGITPDTVTGLHAALDRAESDPTVRAVVLAAAGRVFCAGADLSHVGGTRRVEVADAAPDGLREFLEAVGGLLDRIEAFGKPVVAAVQGLAVAGGLELVLACDIVVAARSAAFGDAHANYGLLPGGGASVRLPRRVGPSTARQLMFTGATVPAADLAHTDLVTHLVDDADLAATVDELVDSIAAKSPLGIARMKELLLAGVALPAEEALRREIDAAAEHAHSADFAEGLAAFADRRRPVFTGR